MLIGIPQVISPRLMMHLMEMGHGDELVLADANFPSRTIAHASTSGEVVRCDGVDAATLLDAILTLMPLDYAAPTPAFGMSAPDDVPAPDIHAAFIGVLGRHGYGENRLAFLPRFDFYARAKHSYVVVASGETARFANLILKKGVVTGKHI